MSLIKQTDENQEKSNQISNGKTVALIGTVSMLLLVIIIAIALMIPSYVKNLRENERGNSVERLDDSSVMQKTKSDNDNTKN